MTKILYIAKQKYLNNILLFLYSKKIKENKLLLTFFGYLLIIIPTLIAK